MDLLRRAWLCITPAVAIGRRAAAPWHRRHWIEKALAGIDDAIIATDSVGRVMFLNARAETMTGWPIAKAFGRPLRDLLQLKDERDATASASPVAQLLEDLNPDEWVREKVLTRPDGRTFPVEYRAAPIPGADSRKIGTVLLVRDVTGRRRVQEAMAQLAAIVEYSDDAIVGVAMDGTITNWNPGARRLYGYDADEIVGRPLALLHPPEGAPDLEEVWATVRRGESMRHFDAVRLRRDGERITVSVSLSPIKDSAGEVVGFSSIARDVTERNRLEAEARRNEVLRRLANAQEEERRRIARELHDSVGQYLTALKLGLEAMALIPSDPERLQQLLRITNQTAQEVRRIALELRPTALDDLGLKTALVRYAQDWSARSGIEVEFQSTGLDGDRLSPEIETMLYRVVQEALTNVLKHARAERVSLLLERVDHRLVTMVEDDGVGFDYEAVTRAVDAERGLGFLGMRERVAAVGGELQVESSPGNGTTLLIRVPLPGDRG